MIGSVSPNTQVILLLTAPLIMRGGEAPADLLSLGLYKKLAKHLRSLEARPADLLMADAAAIIAACDHIVDSERLRTLLGRGFLLSQVIERWQARAIWIISRADPAYPRRLKHWLREDAPPILYGCGAIERLDDGGLAVVGSRHVDDRLVTYTEAIGALAARSDCPVVSGGARGIDQAAMRGAADGGGQIVGVLADSLEKSAMLREHRAPLMEGRLVLISPYDPSARFNVGHAMQRNKLIYALADAALVVSSDLGKGGTWAGAIEQLDKLRFTRVYVRQDGYMSAGLDALLRKGAIPWPEPRDRDAFVRIFQAEAKNEDLAIDSTTSQRIGLEASVSQIEVSPDDGPLPVVPADDLPAARLWHAVRSIVSALLTEPRGEADVADTLKVSKAQAREWLTRLTAEGVVQRTKSKQYVAKSEELFT